MKKICKLCLEYKDFESFSYARTHADKKDSYCKTCKAQINRDRYKKNPNIFKTSTEKWMKLNPDKVKAHAAVRRALNKGLLFIPNFCDICGCSEKLEAHHWHGYKKESRLDVQWLCRKCHKIEDSLVVL